MVFSGNWYEDLALLTEYIKEVRFIQSTDRRKIGIINKKSYSVLYGLTYKKPPNIFKEPDPNSNLYRSVAWTEYPHLLDVFKEFSGLYFSGRVWDSIQININFRCNPHKDKKNCGRSVLVAMGDYTGGKTCIDINGSVVKLDARDYPVIFDGSKYTHYVEPYEGVRYSLVFFENFKRKKIS